MPNVEKRDVELHGVGVKVQVVSPRYPLRSGTPDEGSLANWTGVVGSVWWAESAR